MTTIRDLPAAARDALYLSHDGPIPQRAIDDAARRNAGAGRPAVIPVDINELRAEISALARAHEDIVRSIQLISRVADMPRDIKVGYTTHADMITKRLGALHSILAGHKNKDMETVTFPPSDSGDPGGKIEVPNSFAHRVVSDVVERNFAEAEILAWILKQPEVQRLYAQRMASEMRMTQMATGIS